MLVFSEQNVIPDPPFSRLDLIGCCNLLIYMGGGLQEKLIPLFHYTLNPGGVLFLGTSETVGELSNLFAVVDVKAKLYKRKLGFDGAPRLAHGRFSPPLTAADGAPLQALAARCGLIGVGVGSAVAKDARDGASQQTRL